MVQRRCSSRLVRFGFAAAVVLGLALVLILHGWNYVGDVTHGGFMGFVSERKMSFSGVQYVAPPLTHVPLPPPSAAPATPPIAQAEATPKADPTPLPTQNEDNDNDDFFLSEGKTYIGGEKRHHDTDSPKNCRRWVTRQQITEFRTSEKVAELGTTKIKQPSGEVEAHRAVTYTYINKVMEYAPVVTVHSNVVANDFFDTNVRGGVEVAAGDVLTVNHTMYRGKRFDMANPYEAHHAYFNAYLAFRMLKIDPRAVQFIHNDDHLAGAADEDVWAAVGANGPFSRLPVYGLRKGEHAPSKHGKKQVHFTTVIESQSAGTSLLVTNSAVFGSQLGGRGKAHKCKSTLVVDFAGYMRRSSGVPPPLTAPGVGKGTPEAPYVVIWSSRATYTHVTGKVTHPARHIAGEDVMLSGVQKAVGGSYVVKKANFASGYTFKELVAMMAEVDVLSGVHGAGLIYSLYLRPHAGLVEFFGGNRGPGNKHYSNIAAYCDLHYLGLQGHKLDGGKVGAQFVNALQKLTPLLGKDPEA